MEGLIVGLPCGHLKTKGIAIFVDIENGALYFIFLCISSDISKSRGNISLKSTRPVRPVSFGAVDLIEITMGQRMDGISTHIRLRKMIPGPITDRIGHHIASKFFHKFDQFDIVQTGAINENPWPFLEGDFPLPFTSFRI